MQHEMQPMALKPRRMHSTSLKRTYGDCVPAELLEIDNLRKMSREYEKILPLIDEYNAKKRGLKKRLR